MDPAGAQSVSRSRPGQPPLTRGENRKPRIRARGKRAQPMPERSRPIRHRRHHGRRRPSHHPHRDRGDLGPVANRPGARNRSGAPRLPPGAVRPVAAVVPACRVIAGRPDSCPPCLAQGMMGVPSRMTRQRRHMIRLAMGYRSSSGRCALHVTPPSTRVPGGSHVMGDRAAGVAVVVADSWKTATTPISPTSGRHSQIPAVLPLEWARERRTAT
jgi:hypothetical protein